MELENKFLTTPKIRSVVLAMLLGVASVADAQQLNIGGFVGTGPIGIDFAQFFNLGGTIEYQPNKSISSFSLDPTVHCYDKNFYSTFPLYVKFNIGKTFRVCPTLGIFARTDFGGYGSYGWSMGLGFEYSINDQSFVYLKSDYMKDYFNPEIPTHHGTEVILDNKNSIWISLGIKKNILKIQN